MKIPFLLSGRTCCSFSVLVRGRPQAQVGLFVAGRAERIAQAFTGLCVRDPGRDKEVDKVIFSLGDLWNSEISQRRFQDCANFVSMFPGLGDSPDGEIVARLVFRPPCKVYSHGFFRLGVHTYCSGQPAWRKHRARVTCVSFRNPMIKYTRWGPWRSPGQKSSITCNFQDGYDHAWVDLR